MTRFRGAKINTDNKHKTEEAERASKGKIINESEHKNSSDQGIQASSGDDHEFECRIEKEDE